MIYDEEELGQLEKEYNEYEQDVEIKLRKKEIVDWLAQSVLAKPLTNKDGFFVHKGPRVRLEDGSIRELLRWLFEEEFSVGSEVAGYRVAHPDEISDFGEKLCFLSIVVDAPFVPVLGEDNPIEYDEDGQPLMCCWG